MSLRKYANMRDENEQEIVDALESIGCTVFRLDVPCDLLVGRGAVNILIEVKNPEKPRSARKKTNQQTRTKRPAKDPKRERSDQSLGATLEAPQENQRQGRDRYLIGFQSDRSIRVLLALVGFDTRKGHHRV